MTDEPTTDSQGDPQRDPGEGDAEGQADAAAPDPSAPEAGVPGADDAGPGADGSGGDSAANAAERALKAAQEAIRGLQAQGQDAAPAAGAPAGRPSTTHTTQSSRGGGQGDGGRPMDLPSFGAADAAPATGRGLDLLSDVNLNVRIELGRTRMLVEDVLRLGEGAVVELDKLAGDPVDIFVNGRPVARGEVLVLNDNFCVRISEILDEAKERVQREAAG